MCRLIAAVLAALLTAPAWADSDNPSPYPPLDLAVPATVYTITPALTCDATTTTGDGAITSGLNVFTTSSVTFKASDVGKAFSLAQAGANQFLSAAAVSAAGTGYIPFSTITLAPGSGTSPTAAAARITSTKVVSATVAAPGSGGTDGTQTVTGTTGQGTLFTASVTVSGGAITAVLSITSGGSYTVNPTALATEPVTGGGVTGGQLNVVMGVNAANVYTNGVFSAVDTGAGALTQASTSGSGSGATFTGTYVRYPLVTTISGFTNASTVTLAANAAATVTTGDFWVYGTDNSTSIQAAISKAHTAGGGRVLLPSPGAPCAIGTGLSLTGGVTLQGVQTTRYQAPNATPQQWGGNGSWLQPLDLTNPAITLTNHGVTVDGLSFIYAQPVPSGSWQPVPYPYAIQGCSNLSRVQHITDIAGTHGINIACTSGAGGGTGAYLDDLKLSTFMVGLAFTNINDLLIVNFPQVRNLFYNSTASVVSFLQGNLIGINSGLWENGYLTNYECFECFAGIMLTDGTVSGNTHSLYNAFINNVQFGLARAAIVATDNTTAKFRADDVIAHGDTSLNNLSDPLFNLVSDNLLLDMSDFTLETAGGPGIVLGAGVGSTLTMGSSNLLSWGSIASGTAALNANAGATIYSSGATNWGLTNNRRAGNGSFTSIVPTIQVDGGGCVSGFTGLYKPAASEIGTCVNGNIGVVTQAINGIAGQTVFGAANPVLTSNDVVSVVANANGNRSLTLRNTNASSSAQMVLNIGNNTSATETSLTLNGGANTSGNGANSFTLAAGGGFFITPNTKIAGTLTNSGIAAAAGANQVCSGTGGIFTTVASGTACAVSAMRYKNPLGEVSFERAEARIKELHSAFWIYKDTEKFGDKVHVGLYADDVAKMDSRCAVYDKRGRVENYEDRCVIAYLVATVQAQQKQIDALRNR